MYLGERSDYLTEVFVFFWRFIRGKRDTCHSGETRSRTPTKGQARRRLNRPTLTQDTTALTSRRFEVISIGFDGKCDDLPCKLRLCVHQISLVLVKTLNLIYKKLSLCFCEDIFEGRKYRQ